MTDVRTEVKLYLEQEAPDGLAYIDCPECGNKDKLMLIPLDDGGTFYKCLRASCPTSGSVGTTYRATTERETRDVKQGRKVYPRWATELDYRPTPDYLPSLCAGVYTDLFGTKRYIFPIQNRYAQEVGYVARSNVNKEYKALVRPYSTSGSLLAWYRPSPLEEKTKTIVLVEDQVSAHRISRAGVISVALLGTSVGYYDEVELINKNVIVCLDNDALADGLRLARQLGGHFWPLPGPDVKDMGKLEFARFIDNVSSI